MRIKTTSSHNSGYLLLEVTLAILISTIILSTVFKITQWNLRVSNDAILNSNKHMKESALFSFFDRAFLELPGDALIEYNETETTHHFLSEIIIQNAGETFSWPGQPFSPRAVKIRTKPNPDNSIDILLEYYQDYLITDPRVTQNELVEPDQEPVQTLILMDDILKFEWGVWNGRSLTRDSEPFWEREWNQRNLPRYFELRAKFSLEEEEVRHVFWLPQKVNPDQFITQQVNSAQPNNPTDNGGNANRGNPSAPGSSDN